MSDSHQHQPHLLSLREIKTHTLRKASAVPMRRSETDPPPPAVPALPPPPPRAPTPAIFISPTRGKRSATLPTGTALPLVLRDVILRSNQYSNLNNNDIRPRLSSVGSSPPKFSLNVNGNENTQILYSHPYSKIVSFTVTGNNTQWDTEQHLLPSTNLTDNTIAKGPIKLYRAKPHNTAFIQSGKTVHPVMAKSTCWCVEEVVGKGVWGRGRGKGVFVLRIRLGTYWRVEINEAGMNGAVEEFKNALREVLSFEKEECPFVRMDVVFVGQDEKDKDKELRKKEKEWISVKQSMDTPKAKGISTSPSPFLRPKNPKTKPPISRPSGGPPPTPLPSPILETYGDLLPPPAPDPIKLDVDLALRPRSPRRPGSLIFGPSKGLPPPTPLLSPYFSPGMVSFDDLLPTPMRNESYVHLSDLLNTEHTSDQNTQYKTYEDLSELNRNHTISQDVQPPEQISCELSPIDIAPAVNSVDSLSLSKSTYSVSATSYASPPAEASKPTKPQKGPSGPSYRQPWAVPPPKTTTEMTLTNSETTFITTYGDDDNFLSQLGSVVPQSGKMLSAAADLAIVKPSVFLVGFMQRMARNVVCGRAVEAGAMPGVLGKCPGGSG
ncbi:inheritance of peroxisomes protein 1-domain-containing protein [Tirmania nivea]|nr:inheritance of peroxisomes protein 1-domain-containing protein [Tirmania nivea]